MKKVRKAVALLSGGLDSLIATELVIRQSVKVEGVNFVTAFCTCTPGGQGCLAGRRAAEQLGINLKVFSLKEEYLDLIKDPKYGYGRNMNPCLDCRILMFKKAGEYMKKVGASFLVTGEVLGERPMSQRRDTIMLIEEESGLAGYVVRPLSAKFFEPTVAARKGWIDREKFLEIKGRSRKPQIKLAEDLEMTDYPCPAGGCLLTEEGYSRKIRDLLEYDPDFGLEDIKLLRTGRHFRLSPAAKIVLGRNKEENKALLDMAREEDLRMFPVGTKGPTGLGRGVFFREELEKAARIAARYTRLKKREPLVVECGNTQKPQKTRIKAYPAAEKELEELRV